MEQDGGREHFIIGLDTAQLDRDAQGARAAFENLGAAAENVGRQIDQSLSKTDASALRKEMAETEKAIKEVQACIAANNREVEDFKAKIQAAQAQLANGGDKDALTSQIQAYRDTIAAITANSQEFAAEQVQLKSSLSAMSEQWAQLTTDAQQAALAQQAATEAASASASVSAGAQASESVSTATNTEAIAAKTAAEGQAAEATARAAEAAHSAATGNNEEATSVRALKEELKTLSTGLGEINQGLAKFADNAAIEQQERRVAKLADSIAKYKEMLATGKADAGTLGAQKEMERLNAAYDKAVEKLNAMKMELARLQSDQQQYAAAIESTKQKIDEAGNAHTRVAEKVKAYKQEAQKIPTIHNQIAETMKTIGTMTAGYFTVKGIEGFIQKCIEVRKNLELMETRFQGLMGDAGTELLGEIKQMAMDSGTYTTKALSEVAQTLNVYGIETEQIMPLLREFGDVAMGNEQKLSSLAMAFGRLETQGQLSSLTLRTFTRAGFNPLEEMARKTGKSIQQLRTEMSAGLITTQKVKDALKSATSQGGKFYQMTENLSDSIAAEQGRLQMMITKIYAEWGKNHEDMIKGGYQLAQSIVNNYETIGKSIATLIAAYGSYRTVLVINSVLESTRLTALARLIRMQGLATVAQHALNAACKANPYVLLASAVLSLGAAFMIWADRSDASAKAQKRAKEITDQTKNSTEKFNQAVDNLMGTLQNSTASTYEHANALKEIKKKYPNILKDINTYNDYLREQQRIEAQIAQSRAYDPVRNARKNLDIAKQDLEAAKVEVGKAKTAYDIAASLGGEDAAVAQRAAYNTLKIAMEKQTAAQKAVNQYQTSYNKAQQEYKKLVAQAAKEETVHNKAYYEKRKKAAQATIDAMDVSKKGSKEWTKAQKEFIEADTQLQKYSLETTKQRDAKAKAEERRRAKEAKAEERIENQELDGKKKAAEALRKWNEKQAEVEANAEWNRRQAVIDAMEEGSQKQLEQLRLNHDKEMAEIDREAKELWKARVEYQKEVFESKPANKHKDFYKSDTYKALLPQDEKHPLTKEEENKTGLTAKRESSDAKYIREQRDILEAQQQAMDSYLKQYGTLQQQKLALDREYAEKRRKILESSDTSQQKQWQLRDLDQQHKSDLAKIGAQGMAMDIDWGETFGSISNVLSEIAKETLSKVEAYMKTAEFKSLNANDKQSYATLRKNLKNEVGNNASVFNFSIWGDIQKDVNNYQESVRQLKKANAAHTLAVNQLVAAEKRLAENTDETQQSFLQAMVDFNKEQVERTATELQQAQGDKQGAKDQLNDDAEKAAAGIENFQTAMQQLSSGSLKGFADGVANLITSLTKTNDAAGAASQGLAGLGKIGGLVGAILSIIDALGDDPAQFFHDLLEKIEKAVESIIADLPNLVGNIIAGVVNIIKGALNGIGQMFGAEDVIGEIGAHDRKYVEDMERLRQSNNDLAYAIDSLAEIMADQAGAEATATYERQKADLEQREKNLQEDIWRSGNRASSGILGIGSKGSTRRYIDENMSSADWEKVSEAAGVSVKSASDFFQLTSEQMHNVATYASAEWTTIMLHAEDGMESIKDQLNDYIGLWEDAEDALKNYQETLTSLSFDSLKDSMAELLESSETDTEDIIDNINKYLQKAIINTVLTKAGQDRLEAWYTNFADAMSDGVITATEAAALRTSYAQIYDDVNKEYEAAMQAAGLDPEDFDDENGGDSGSWESLGEETGRALEGRFAALQIQTTKIADIVAAQYEANTQSNTQRITALGEMNNLVFTCSEHLERIAANTDALPRMEKKLESIKTNTDRL